MGRKERNVNLRVDQAEHAHVALLSVLWDVALSDLVRAWGLARLLAYPIEQARLERPDDLPPPRTQSRPCPRCYPAQ